MKRFFILVVLLFVLSACGSGNTSTNLESKRWNVVSTNGENYTAEFNQDTVSFETGFVNVGMFYEVDKDVITLTKKDEVYSYEIESNKEEYKFTAVTEETKNKLGDLTLSPVKE